MRAPSRVSRLRSRREQGATDVDEQQIAAEGSMSQEETSINVLSSLTGTVETAFTADES